MITPIESHMTGVTMEMIEPATMVTITMVTIEMLMKTMTTVIMGTMGKILQLLEYSSGWRTLVS